MKKNVKMLALVPLFALSACHSNEGEITMEKTPAEAYPTTTIDTMRVIGVFNVTGQFYNSTQHKFVKCVDKNNRTMEIFFDVGKQPKNDVAYTERGDTILMNGNVFVKNLTQERLQSKFVKGR